MKRRIPAGGANLDRLSKGSFYYHHFRRIFSGSICLFPYLRKMSSCEYVSLYLHDLQLLHPKIIAIIRLIINGNLSMRVHIRMYVLCVSHFFGMDGCTAIATDR